MAVTLADVAARARVSAATVSRVLSGNYPVAEATRARVLRAVDEMEYVVNGPASALAAASSDLVGVLVHDIADPFFGILAGAVQAEMGRWGSLLGAPPARSPGEAGGGGSSQTKSGGEPGRGGEKLAVICSTGGVPARELTYLTLLQRQRAAAVVITGGAVEDPVHAAAVAAKTSRLAAAGTRVVVCGRPPMPDAVALAFDNRGGARRLTEHVLALGHRRIGYVAGPAGRTTTRHRLEGHRAALAAQGAVGAEGAAAERLTLFGPYDRSCGYDATVELLRREPELTAVVAANDTIALGACAALRDQGRRIPQDVSVAGFDDLPFSADATPSLTTVRLPLQSVGARAGRLALGREPLPPGGVAMIRAELMARSSTAPPRPGSAH
ncbi:LacI family transcriptional regulator [Streptomyces albus subsp. albus]|nr:LacI family transcriptional regulator [Streptomyces albus subsp. albus]